MDSKHVKSSSCSQEMEFDIPGGGEFEDADFGDISEQDKTSGDKIQETAVRTNAL